MKTRETFAKNVTLFPSMMDLSRGINFFFFFFFIFVFFSFCRAAAVNAHPIHPPIHKNLERGYFFAGLQTKEAGHAFRSNLASRLFSFLRATNLPSLSFPSYLSNMFDLRRSSDQLKIDFKRFSTGSRRVASRRGAETKYKQTWLFWKILFI